MHVISIDLIILLLQLPMIPMILLKKIRNVGIT